MITRIKPALLGVFVLMCVAIGLMSEGVAQRDMTSARSERAKSIWTPVLKVELDAKGLSFGSPVFLRLTKTTSAENQTGYLEAFVQADHGAFISFKKWEICTYSGELGPKLKE